MSETLKKQIEAIVSRAWDDDNFKTALVAQPEQALKSIGMTLPEDCKVRVSDQSDPTKVYLNLLPENIADELELSEEQLEQVSGGFVIGAVVGLILSAGGAAGSQTDPW
jgi:hypothetical protein